MKRLFIFIIALLVAAPCFGEGSVAIPVSPFDPRGNLRDIADEPDPEEDKLWFFDVTDGKVKLVTLGTNLSISGTTLNASGGGSGDVDAFAADPSSNGNFSSANWISDLGLSGLFQPLDSDLTDLADGSLTGTKVAFADTNNDFTATNVQAAIEELVSTNGSGPNAADGKVSWTQLVDIPEGFADGSDDGSGGSSGTLNTIKANGSAVGGSDIVTLDFSSEFGVSESPDTEINLTISSTIARDTEVAGYFADPTTNTGFNPSTWVEELELDALYQPLDADLTTWAGVTPGTGVATFLATPSSANLATAVTGETGSGALVFGTSPTLTTPNLGTPSAVTLTNATGLPISTGVSGLGTGVATMLATPSSANVAAAVTDETGSGALVFGTSPTISAPTLNGTPTIGDAAAWRTAVGVNIRTISIVLMAPTTAASTGDGKAYFEVPASMNGAVITAARLRAITAGTTGTTDVQLHNVTDAVDVFSTKLTIDSTEPSSSTAATPVVINTSNDDLATGDLLRVDVPAVSTTPPQGLIFTIEVTK